MKNNLDALYALVHEQDEKREKLFDTLKKGDAIPFIDEELRAIGLSPSKENRYALITRLVNLRDDALVQSLEQIGHKGEKLEALKMEVYRFVSQYYLQLHSELLEEVKRGALLSDFYIALLEGVHAIGEAMTDFHRSWYWHILVAINPELTEKFGSSQNVMKYLKENDLLDRDEEGAITDRSYSVLLKENEGYKIATYAEAFDQEIGAVIAAISRTLSQITLYEDEEFGQKEHYIAYFAKLMLAFSERNSSKTLTLWADVDRAWMDVQSPIQVGHPLEYYEDHFRKAVAPEWDIRLSNPALQSKNRRAQDIEKMFISLHKELDAPMKLKEGVLANVRRTQLYLGRPALYYGAEFNGLFSAQVVPNDEDVSSERGKKIFAFADMVLQSSKAKPVMKIATKIFGKEFVKERRDLMFQNPTLWHHLYDIETIGHEFGHILWVDEQSETAMNDSAQYKNIEEFKATTGGLVSFFHSEEKEIVRELTMSIISRSVGLIAWMQTEEVQPYYCEGLIHLSGLFESKVLAFENEKLTINLDAYENMKNWYLETYKNLADHYIEKRDAKEFLDKFTIIAEGNFLPSNDTVRSFVQYYWKLHQKIGREIDENLE